ncbi:MAG: AAA family ATPase [Nocardiopsaceae bacterium]|nr:AAA family ATPase [Nocardiopsaceae bacterium]
MSEDNAAGRFWRELQALYRAAGRPTLRRLVHLGLEQHPPIQVSSSTINGWLNGKAVPAGRKNTRYLTVMVAFLQARVGPGAAFEPLPAVEWGRLLRAAQAERAAGKKKGRPRRLDIALRGTSAREPRAGSTPARERTPAVPAVPAGRLVGRDSERALLAGLVGAVAAGRGGTVLVEGEPGIGKTALVQGVAAAAVSLGCQVFWGTGSELDQALPLQPLLDALRVREDSPSPRREAIARLLRGEVTMDCGMNGAAVLAEQLLALMAEECAARPTILVIDDLQWADQASIRLLDRLAGSARGLPLLLIGMMRPVPQRDDLLALRRAVGGHAARLPLAALDNAAVTELVAALAGGTPDRQLLRLAGDAAGNPLYLTELVQAMARSSRVTITSDGVATLMSGPVPLSLAAAIADRLSFLSAPAREALQAASLLGVEFAVTDLAISLGRSVTYLAGILCEACAAGVLAESGSRLRFRHPLIHEALYEEMPAPVRAARHREVGRALVAAEVPADRVARQVLSASSEPDGLPEPMEGWMLGWLAGAAEALVSQATPVAAELLNRAVASVPPGSPQYALLASRLASALYHIGEKAAAEQLAGRVLEHAADPDLLVDLHWTLALCRMAAGKPAESLAALGRALAAPGLSPRHRARLLVLAARTHVNFGEFEKGAGAAASALATAEGEGDTWAMGWATHVLALVAMLRGRSAEALSLYDRGLAVAQADPALADLWLLLHINKAATLGNLDRHEEALAAAGQARRLARQVGTTIRLAQAHGILSDLLFETGRWDDALAEMTIVPETLKEPAQVCDELGIAAVISFHRGNAAAARGYLSAAAPYARRLGRRGIPPLALARSLDHEHAGALPEALAALTDWLGDNTEELRCTPDLIADAVRLAMHTRDLNTAQVLAIQAVKSATGSQPPYWQANALYCRGLLDHEASALLCAADRYHHANRPLHRAKALEAAASEYAHAGDRKAARSALVEAAEIYARLGATVDAAQARATAEANGIELDPHSVLSRTEPRRHDPLRETGLPCPGDVQERLGTEDGQIGTFYRVIAKPSSVPGAPS